MTKQEARAMALGAARSQLRRTGHDPKTTGFAGAWEALDGAYREVPGSEAGQWYIGASDAQVAAFKREWEQWRRGS